MTEKRYIVQLLEYSRTGQLMALCNDSTIRLYDSVFNTWEPVLADHRRNVAAVPQPVEDPWL
ncbi:MAG: hypothetical protein JSU65_04405 [Candidatus Zixiibacteriota bacterium]|nr:MAG: hypothetical protein JSU65_04405 [candidate division Zixibacteria bacterium]